MLKNNCIQYFTTSDTTAFCFENLNIPKLRNRHKWVDKISNSIYSLFQERKISKIGFYYIRNNLFVKLFRKNTKYFQISNAPIIVNNKIEFQKGFNLTDITTNLEDDINRHLYELTKYITDPILIDHDNINDFFKHIEDKGDGKLDKKTKTAFDKFHEIAEENEKQKEKLIIQTEEDKVIHASTLSEIRKKLSV